MVKFYRLGIVNKLDIFDTMLIYKWLIFVLQNPYNHNLRRSTIDNKFNFGRTEELTTEAVATHDSAMLANSRDSTMLIGANAPDLPPRIDRTSKPPSNNITPSSTLLTTTSARNAITLNTSANRNGSYGRSAHEQLFAEPTSSSLATTLADATAPLYDDEYSTRVNPASTDNLGTLNASSLDRKHSVQLMSEKGLRSPSSSNTPANGKTNSSAYDSVSSYDSCNVAMQNLRLGPNAPDDLKSVPSVA